MSSKLPARFYYDIISPFAYLYIKQRKRLEEKLEITPVPILLGLCQLTESAWSLLQRHANGKTAGRSQIGCLPILRARLEMLPARVMFATTTRFGCESLLGLKWYSRLITLQSLRIIPSHPKTKFFYRKSRITIHSWYRE